MKTFDTPAAAHAARPTAPARMTALVAVAVVFSACCPCRRTASTLPLVGTGWQLAQLYGEAVSDLREGSYTLLVGSDGRLSGRGECNRFSGSATRTESSPSSGALRMGAGLVATRMMCVSGAEREARYLRMLSEFDSYSIDGARLLLIRDGDVLAIFDRAAFTPPAPPAM